MSTCAVLINIVTFYFYSAEQMFMKSTLRNSWYLNINFEIFILNQVGGLLFFANIFPHEERMFLDVDDYGWPIGGSVFSRALNSAMLRLTAMKSGPILCSSLQVLGGVENYKIEAGFSAVWCSFPGRKQILVIDLLIILFLVRTDTTRM